MANFVDALNTITDRWDTQVATPQSLTTVYDNDGTDPPDTATWCRFTVLQGDSIQTELSGAHRHFGVAVAQLFVPLNNGATAAMALADATSTAFRATTVSGVTFRTPSVQRVGVSGRWFQVNVRIPYQTNEVA